MRRSVPLINRISSNLLAPIHRDKCVNEPSFCLKPQKTGSNLLIVFVVFSTLSAGMAQGAEVSLDTAARVGQVGERAVAMATGKVAEYARDFLTAAQTTLLAAQVAVAAGNEKQALQKAEMSELQLTVAEAKAAEKELAEQTALCRAELKKLEARLERYLQGGE